MKTPEEKRIIELVNSNTDWTKLNSELLKENFIFEKYTDSNSKKNFVELIRELYSNNIQSINTSSDIFGREIIFENVKFNIYGLIHSNPIIILNPEFGKDVEQKLGDKDIICEDGFCDWLKNAQSFKEKKNLNLKNNLSEKISSLTIAIVNKISHEYTKIETIASNVKSIDDYMLLRPLLFRNYFGEPLGMNSELYIHNPNADNCTLENSINLVVPNYLKRIIYEAKESIRYAKENNFKELNIIVGCAHERPLEYLLQNPKILNTLNY
jgi:hypothetical protein